MLIFDGIGRRYGAQTELITASMLKIMVFQVIQTLCTFHFDKIRLVHFFRYVLTTNLSE